MPTRFGIIGCGGAALPVAQALFTSQVIELQRVYDIDHALAADLGERYGAECATSVDELLADPTVDAVYIAVPHDRLAPLARQVLAAGKHALVEKPLALTLAQADELIALAEQQRLALGVFYELRYSTPFIQARELVHAGAIGQIIGVRIQTLIDKPTTYWQAGLSGRAASPWRGQAARAGGGVVLMNTSHQLDAVRAITGLEVVRVTAEIGTLVAAVEVEDLAAATLHYDNGAIGSIFAGAHLPGASAGSESFDIYGTHGQIMAPDPYGDAALQVFLRRSWGELAVNTWQRLPSAPMPLYTRAVEAFAQAIQRNEPAPIGGHDARQVLAIVLAIYQAAAEKRMIVLEAQGTNISNALQRAGS
jgi:UDP-N-acetyl-2-amino-2-deoxyglucuronate dehydrogenase